MPPRRLDMTIDLLFGAVAIAVIVIVFRSRGRREKATTASRESVLQAAAPILGGSFANGAVTGTYREHRVEASLRTTARLDMTSDGHSSTNNIEVVLLVVHGVSGKSPWSFFTEVSFAGALEDRWRSGIAFAGVLGKLFSHMSPIPTDPGVDDRLRAGGMLAALERFVPPNVKAPYVFVSFYPDAAPVIARNMQRAEAAGVRVPAKARDDAAELLKQGGHLRIEVERTGDGDPTPERLRELLDAALTVADLNASINR